MSDFSFFSKMPLPSAAVQSALQLQERRLVQKSSGASKTCLQDIFFFVGGCKAPLKSVSAASGWSKRGRPYEHDTSTMSSGAGSAELLCAVSRQQEVWNWLDLSLLPDCPSVSLTDHFDTNQKKKCYANTKGRFQFTGGKRKIIALRSERWKRG